jgi:hypothetical protein
MQVLSELSQLSKVDFYGHFLTGTLPAAVQFPRLEELRLAGNDVTVSLPNLSKYHVWKSCA